MDGVSILTIDCTNTHNLVHVGFEAVRAVVKEILYLLRYNTAYSVENQVDVY